MKKGLIALLLLIASGTSAKLFAQRDMKAFQHISLGINLGTTGVGLDIATPLNHHLALRAGVSFVPYTYQDDFDTEMIDPDLNARSSVNLKCIPGLNNGKLVLDYFPFNRSGFHLTGGLYAGQEKLLTVEGESDEPIVYEDYIIHPVDGMISAGVKVAALKPYFGLGFGRSIPTRRIGFKFEIGAMYQGKPEVFSTDPSFVQVVNSEIEHQGMTKWLNYGQLYPVVNFNLFVRLTK